MGKYFGTDGFRGEANVVLTVEHAFKAVSYTHLVCAVNAQICLDCYYKFY